MLAPELVLVLALVLVLVLALVLVLGLVLALALGLESEPVLEPVGHMPPQGVVQLLVIS